MCKSGRRRMGPALWAQALDDLPVEDPPCYKAIARGPMKAKSLGFTDLFKRHVGVTAAISASYFEAACVCLDRHHASPARFQLRDNQSADVADAQWDRMGQRERNAWANQDDATEAGACGLALAAVELMRGLVAVRRAETQTGVDYYLGKPKESLDHLEASFRLEISGIDKGAASYIEYRLRRKIAQAEKGRSNLPAIASVVVFAALQIVTADVDNT